MTESAPPGLSLQGAVHGPCCRVCTSYDGGTRCKRYDVLVTPNTQSDSFTSIFTDGSRQFAEP